MPAGVPRAAGESGHFYFGENRTSVLWTDTHPRGSWQNRWWVPPGRGGSPSTALPGGSGICGASGSSAAWCAPPASRPRVSRSSANAMDADPAVLVLRGRGPGCSQEITPSHSCPAPRVLYGDPLPRLADALVVLPGSSVPADPLTPFPISIRLLRECSRNPVSKKTPGRWKCELPGRTDGGMLPFEGEITCFESNWPGTSCSRSW